MQKLETTLQNKKKGIKMEIIGTGILLAIGFYVAPMIITVIVGAIIAIASFVLSLFGGK